MTEESLISREKVVKKFKERLNAEKIYLMLAIGGTAITFIAGIFNIWYAIVPVILVTLYAVLELKKIANTTKYLNDKYKEHAEEDKLL